MGPETIMSWNARGLNTRARRDVVAEVVWQERVSLLCIQESKLVVVNDSLINSMLDSSFAYDFVPAIGMCGGILVAWPSDVWSVSLPHQTPHSLSLRLSSSSSTHPWWLTTVYGPHVVQDKPAFLQELREIRGGRLGPWLICGDFNLIYKAEDKSNSRLNRQLMGKFR
jgi:hypothetical protein